MTPADVKSLTQWSSFKPQQSCFFFFYGREKLWGGPAALAFSCVDHGFVMIMTGIKLVNQVK